MPLNSVQLYVKNLLDGVQLPLNLGTLTAYITPPDPGDGTDPVVYVWGSVADERRQTMPRHKPGQYSTGGFKEINHAIDLWLVYCVYADDELVDSLYPVVIDAVCGILRDTGMPTPQIFDEITNQGSYIQAIGEHITWDYAPVHSLMDQRMLRYSARITVDVLEILQA